MENAIELDNVSKQFKENKLYDQVNLVVKQGECIGVVGANGTGKSVLYKMIAGVIDPDSGNVKVHGIPVGTKRDFPKDMGILVNQPGYVGHLSGLENLKLLASINNLVDEDGIRKIMKRVQLDPSNKTKVKNYSTGMKQKLGIAQAIMEGQTIILLDEPFSGLDYESNIEIMAILKEIKASGATLLLTSHQQNFLDEICDRMYLITNKSILELDDQLKKKYFKTT